jgi:hypothetical protein
MFCAPGLVFGGNEGVGSRFHVLRARTHFLRYRGRRVPFSCFVRLDSFSAVPRASGTIFIFLRARTRVRAFRGRRVPFTFFCAPGLKFSCFALPDSFSAEPRASVPVFMFCAPGLAFGGTDGVGPHFDVLYSRTRFWLYRRSQISFSYFARPDSFSAVLRASDPVYMFCAPGLVFGGNEGVGSCFHVLRARTCFLLYRGLRVQISCFVLLDLFSAVLRASGPVLMYCESGHIFCGTEGVGYRFHVLRAQTRFRRYRVRWVPFSCVARSDSFLAVPRVSSPIIMFCAPRLVFGDTEGVGSGLIFCVTEGIRSRFHVLLARIHFRQYRGRQVPISCFACPFSFSAVPKASGAVFMYYRSELVFGGTEVVGSRFHVLRAQTHFRRYRGRWVTFFDVLRAKTHFWLYRGRQVTFFIFLPARTRLWGNRGRRLPFSCFACPDSFSAVPRASSPIYMFCALGLIFGCTEGVRSLYHDLRARTLFRPYRGRQVPFTCFALLDSFSAVPRA